MKFGTTKTVCVGLLLAALAIGCVGQFTLTKGSSEYLFTEIATLVMLAAGVAVGFIWGRCPYCGKRLFFKLLKWKTCPNCRRKLEPKEMYRQAKKL